MANLTKFRAPFIGSGDITKFSDLWSIVLGVGVMIMVFGLGQRFAKVVGGQLPGVPATMEKPWGTEQEKEKPKKRLYGI